MFRLFQFLIGNVLAERELGNKRFVAYTVSIPYRQCLSTLVTGLSMTQATRFQFLIGNVLAVSIDFSSHEASFSFNSL